MSGQHCGSAMAVPAVPLLATLPIALLDTHLRNCQMTPPSLWTTLKCTFKLGVNYFQNKRITFSCNWLIKIQLIQEVDTIDKNKT